LWTRMGRIEAQVQWHSLDGAIVAPPGEYD